MSAGPEDFFAVVSDAVSRGRCMRITLKGGKSLEGVPESVSADAENAPPAWEPDPLPPDVADQYGPVEILVRIAGQEILAQEVESFILLDA
jgi:hypothetical protein